MNDPAKNPYAVGSATPGGRFPAAQTLGTINAAATTGTMIGLSLIGGLVFIAGIMSFLTFPDLPEDQSLLRFDADAIATYTLIGQALFEGPAVFNAILMMTDDNLAHAIPVVIGIVGIALQIPTAGKLTSLMEDAKL